MDGDDPGVGQSVSVGILLTELGETPGSESFFISGRFWLKKNETFTRLQC